MDMQKYLSSVLSEVGIPYSFVARGESRLPMLVFNYRERPKDFWDNEQQSTRYSVYVNLFATGNYLQYKNKILEVMKNAGFGLIEVPQAIYLEDIGVFNQPFSFEYYYEK